MAVEDLSTYTKYVETTDYITVSPNERATFANMPRTTPDDNYLYYDFGVDYFDGDFEHYVTVYGGTSSDGGNLWCWGISNNIETARLHEISSYSNLNCRLNVSATNLLVTIEENDSGSLTSDVAAALSLSTAYYLTIRRDEGVGTYGTIYCDIYSDSNRTSLVETISVTLNTSAKNFRYFYAINNRTTADSTYASGYAENYDLSPGSTPASNSKNILLLGVG